MTTNSTEQPSQVNVLFVGSTPADAASRIEANVDIQIKYTSLRDPIDESELITAAAETTVVVGRLPIDASDNTSIRLVQSMGAGVEPFKRDRFPPQAYLCNLYGHGHAVAEHTFMLLLALERDLRQMDSAFRSGNWGESFPERDPAGRFQELRGQTLGLIGFGEIGQAMVPLARAFGMDVIANRSHKPTRSPPEGVEFIGGPDDLEYILQEADAIVLTVPLTDETRGLIGASEFTMMGDNALLINVARGPVVEEDSLYDALSNDKIRGAGIDTWYQYPTTGGETVLPSRTPLSDLDNILMTPHVAGWSDGTTTHRWSVIGENITRIARGTRLKNVVWEPRNST